VLGEEPAVAFQVGDSVLFFAVDGFVEVFDYGGASLFCRGVVGVYVFDEDGEGLGSEAELGGALGAWAGAGDHNVGVAEEELRSADGVAVVVVLFEAEDALEPGAGFGDVSIDEVREKSVDRYRSVIHDAVILLAEGFGGEGDGWGWFCRSATLDLGGHCWGRAVSGRALPDAHLSDDEAVAKMGH
jgi:hypothetical protein